MSDLSNTPDIQEETLDLQEAPSPWIMLFTMLLLIAGLLLASVLMVYHVNKTKTEHGEPGINFSILVAKAKGTMEKDPPPTQAAERTEVVPSGQPSPLQNLKQMISGAGSSDKVRWPRLKLTGFGTSTEKSESFAIINGEQVHTGQIVDKVEVVDIRAHDVIVEYMGERKTLTVDVHD